MPFPEDPPVSIILPADADLNTPPFIYLDGLTGRIRTVGSDGSEIVLDPNATNPIIDFRSADDTNNAFINSVGAANEADLGINGGKFTPADGVQRRGRLYFNGSADFLSLGVIRENNQARRGGGLQFKSDSAYIGFNTDAGGDQPGTTYTAAGGIVHSGPVTIDGRLRPNSDSHYNADCFGQSTTSGLFTYILSAAATPLVFSFSKAHASSDIRFDFHCTLFAQVAGSTKVAFGIEVDGTQVHIAHLFFNNISVHMQVSGTTQMSGISAGNKNVAPLWARVLGAGTLTMDGNDRISVAASEVCP